MINIKIKLKQFIKSFTYFFFDFLKSAIITAAIVIILTKVFILNAIIPSGSMKPTLPIGGIMICSRIDYWFNSPQCGEIIVFTRNAEDDKTAYTKRVVGVPGDIIQIKSGITYINAEKYDEPWLAETPDNLDFGPYIVPINKYFCMGDNRNFSNDCRYWDEIFVDEDRVLARGRLILAPPNKFEVVKY